jgi:hypothetical protein
MRMYVTGDGSWGVIHEQEFAIIRVSDFPVSFFEAMDSEPDSLKLDLAMNAKWAVDKEQGLSLAQWHEVPDTLSRLRFLLDSSDGPTKGQLEEIYLDLRDGLGF